MTTFKYSLILQRATRTQIKRHFQYTKLNAANTQCALVFRYFFICYSITVAFLQGPIVLLRFLQIIPAKIIRGLLAFSLHKHNDD